MERNFLESEPDQSWQQSATRFEQIDGPAITVSKLFEEWEVELVDWDAVFAQW